MIRSDQEAFLSPNPYQMILLQDVPQRRPNLEAIGKIVFTGCRFLLEWLRIVGLIPGILTTGTQSQPVK